MKANLLLILMVLSFGCFAQTGGLRVEPANVAKDVVVERLDKAYQDITTITVANTSNRRLHFGCKATVVGKPAEWKYAPFSRHNRTAPYVLGRNGNGGTIKSKFYLSPGESKVFYLVLEPMGVTGDGRAEVIFFDVASPSKILGKSVVTVEIIERSGPNTGANNSGGPNYDSRPAPSTVRLFPNPARENFFVESPAGVNVGRIEISNALGNRLRKFDRPPGKDGYNVSDLPDGLYLISIYDKQGKKLKTLRLLHRQFGA